METEKNLAVKAYQAPVMESVDVKLQALICASCPSHVQTCSGILSFGGGGGGCSSNNPRSREASSWDDEED